MTPLYRASAAAGAVAAPFFFGLVLVGGALRPDYSHAGQAISELGELGSPVALLQNLNFAIVGLLIFAFILAARILFRGSRALPILLAVVAVGLVLSAAVPCSAGCPWPQEGPASMYLQNVVHLAVGMPIFIASTAAAFLAARWAKGRAQFARYGWYSLATGIVGTMGFMSFGPLSEAGLFGLAQRILVVSTFTWISVSALVAWRST